MTWQEALRAVLKDYADKTHEWGKVDCIQFVSAYVKNRTGTDHAAKFGYDSEEQANALIGDSMESLIASCLGPSKPDAQPGDVVVCHSENLHIPGIMNESYVWAFVKDHGLCRLLSRSILCAWSV